MRIPPIIPLVAVAVVNAVPLRVVVVSSSNGTISHAGHAGDEASVARVATFKVHGGPMMMRPSTAPDVLLPVPTDGEIKHGYHHMGPHPCPMKSGKFGAKLTNIANTFRGAFGLPLIEVGHKIEGNIHGGIIHVTSTKFVGGPLPPHSSHAMAKPMMIAVEPHRQHGHMWHPMVYHHSSFLQRVSAALLTLGPWEGRAVAFVLGCGLGVLFRMIYVLAIVTYRVIKGRSTSDEDQSIVEYAHVIYEYQDDADEVVAAPPNYTDEKAPIQESK